MENKPQLIVNRVQCDYCNDIIISYHIYDFKYCKCNKTAVDGGIDFLKRVGDKYTEMSLYSNTEFSILRENIFRGGRGINGDEPLKNVVLSEINDNWLINLIDYETKLRPYNIYLPYYKLELEYRKKNKIKIDGI
jgi:hypothetical protein